MSKAHLDRVDAFVQRAIADGARVVLGGEPNHELNSATGGYFYKPTVFEGVAPAMEIVCQEVFGPVLTLQTFATEELGVAMANDTEYGLAAYFFSRDGGRCWRVAEALDYGMVCINSGLISNEMAPFGGVKQSGLGREGSHYGIDEYLEIKYLAFGGI